MSVVSDEQRAARVVGSSAVLFGACAVLMPRLLTRAFGIERSTLELIYLLRFAGVANLALGLNLLAAENGVSRRRLTPGSDG